MQLYKINLARLQHNDAGKFVLRLLEDVSKMPIDLKKDPVLAGHWAQLKESVDAFIPALNQINAREETAVLFALDHHRDLKLITVRRQIDVFEYSDEPEQQKAYHAAILILNVYKGLENTNYEAESLGIQTLLAEWQKPVNTTYAKWLLLDVPLANLKASEIAFSEKFGTRSIVNAEKIVYDGKALRKAMIDSYIAMAEYVLVIAKNHKEIENYAKLLDAINNVRHYFADILARRGGKGGGATPAPDAPKED